MPRTWLVCCRRHGSHDHALLLRLSCGHLNVICLHPTHIMGFYHLHRPECQSYNGQTHEPRIAISDYTIYLPPAYTPKTLTEPNRQRAGGKLCLKKLVNMRRKTFLYERKPNICNLVCRGSVIGQQCLNLKLGHYGRAEFFWNKINLDRVFKIRIVWFSDWVYLDKRHNWLQEKY